MGLFGARVELSKSGSQPWKHSRLARAGIVLRAEWTSRFVHDHETVGPGEFHFGDREVILSE